jgi:NAD(P)H dehydrogenase (quinone)
MSLVITGAGGQLGRLTAELVLAASERDELVLVSRRPDTLSELASRGATVRAGDFDDPATLVDAFAGGDRLLLISTDALGRRVGQHVAAIEAAREAGVSHISYTSVSDPVDGNLAAVVPEHKATEEALAASGMTWAFLRNALYSEFRVPEAQAAVAHGEFTHNFGEARHAFVSRADCAAAAAAVLRGGAEHDGVAYDITGPALLGGDELAAIYAAVGGRPVQAKAVDDETEIAGLVAAGIPREGAEVISSFGTAIRAGHLGELTTAVEDLTGRPPADLETVLRAAGVGAQL